MTKAYDAEQYRQQYHSGADVDPNYKWDTQGAVFCPECRCYQPPDAFQIRHHPNNYAKIYYIKPCKRCMADAKEHLRPWARLQKDLVKTELAKQYAGRIPDNIDVCPRCIEVFEKDHPSQRYCRQCKSEVSKAQYEHEKYFRSTEALVTAPTLCTECGQHKRADAFRYKRRRESGVCKACISKAKREKRRESQPPPAQCEGSSDETRVPQPSAARPQEDSLHPGQAPGLDGS